MIRFRSWIEARSIRAGFTLFRTLLAFIFLSASLEKWTQVGVPEYFSEQFAPTILAEIPYGIPIGFFGIATLEGVTGIILLLSLFRRAPNLYAHLGFLLSESTFLALSIGLRISKKYADAASLFSYFTLTLAIHAISTSPKLRPTPK